MKKNYFSLFIVLFILSFFSSCRSDESTVTEKTTVIHPEWSRDAVIYEVNVRQYSPEGTFDAFRNDLPRLKEMGIDILWLMPVFPIGELNRKTSQTILIEEIKNKSEKEKYLGSYYSTKDYYTINPEFGTEEDFKALVDSIHQLGMYIILDIAINHTAWDHEWVTTHPEYYTRIEKGQNPWNKEWMKEHPEYFNRIRKLGMTYPINPEETDWWDVAELNFDNMELRKELIEVFKFWIEKYDIDGYRCDHSQGVPLDFWEALKPELDNIKPVFMLSESEEIDHHIKAFDMTYDWKLHHIFNKIAAKTEIPYRIAQHFQWVDSVYPRDSYLMQFTSNHDENSWNGTEFERMGDGAKTFAVLSATLPDMLLIYNGQESAFDRRLKFFEKDSITWGNYEYTDFYKSLISLKKRNKALFNGSEGGRPEVLSVPSDSVVFAFKRESGKSKVLVICNLRDTTLNYALNLPGRMKNMREIFTGDAVSFNKNTTITLSPWQYYIYESAN
jgi:glycosidase